MKTKFGHMPCPDCVERVVVYLNENETLSYSCQECKGNGVAKKDQEARYANWVKNITRVAAPAKPAKEPENEPARKPAGRKDSLDEFMKS